MGYAFNGVLYPDVPRGCELLHVAGSTNVPAADGSTHAYVDGYGSGGGVDHLLNLSALPYTNRMQARLIAYGLGLYDYENRYTSSGTLAASGVSSALDGATSPEGELLPTGTLAVQTLVVSVSPSAPAAGVAVLENSSGRVLGYASPGAPLVIEGGTLIARSSGDPFNNRVLISNLSGSTGVNYSVSVCLRQESARYDLVGSLATCDFDSDGTPVLHAPIDPIRTGVAWPSPMEAGGNPPLQNVLPSENGSVVITERRGLSVFVVNGASSQVPTSASVYAEALVAVWKP